MTSKIAKTLTVAGALAMLLALSTLALAQKPGGKQARYTFTDLAGEASYTDASLYGGALEINEPDSGGALLVAGRAFERAAVWEVAANGVVLDLYDPAAARPDMRSFHAASVNDAGLVVGTFAPEPDDFEGTRAFADVPGVGTVELPESAWPAFFNHPTAVNNLGQIVGWSGLAGGIRWTIDANGLISRIDYLGDFFPFAINDSGVMAGTQGDSPLGDGSAAIAWFEGDTLRVLALPVSGRAFSINNFNEVVGSGWSRHPFLWSAENGLLDLGSLGGSTSGGTTGEALAINDQGQIVGWSFNRALKARAFLWENGRIRDLNAMTGNTNMPTLTRADCINNAGHIVGQNDSGGGFLLTPNP